MASYCKEAAAGLLEWEPVSERVITARFDCRAFKVTIIQLYAPTDDTEDEDKDAFYHQLQATLQKIKRRDIKIVIGDNAKAGTENTGKEDVMEKEGMRTSNENGECLIEMCQANGLSIGGTFYSHIKSAKMLPGFP